MNPLLNAILRDDLPDARRLIELGADIEARDDQGRTPLMHSVIEGNDLLVHLFLEHNARVNSSDKKGFTPLHFAAQGFRTDAAHALLAAGANVDAIDQHGNTPLWRATFESKNRGAMIHLLLRAGADPNLKNLSGVSPLNLADTIANYDIRQFFS